MRTILFLIVFLSFILSCNRPINDSETELTVINNIVVPDSLKKLAVDINVEGMSCEGCETTIADGINELDGIKFVAASHIEKKVVVALDSTKTNLKAVKEKINETGYKVVEQ